MAMNKSYWTDRIKGNLERAGELVTQANQWLKHSGENISYVVQMVEPFVEEPKKKVSKKKEKK